MRDYDVRQSVWRLLEQEHANDDDTLMLDELSILNGSTRVDIAVINGEITGYELKSERDTLDRLPTQRDLYNRVLDRVSIVVAENHRDAALRIIPEWWGVWIAHSTEQNRVEVSQEREAKKNVMLDAETICSFLWRDEALQILESMGASRGVKSKPREAIYKRLTEVLSLDEICVQARKTLKTRQGWRVDRRLQKCDG
ncbi:MAG: hypothetical protein CSB47_10425 [Proteobacteria bacterium]|nr:MAG: hypothetical protein CSB47_10425 [Pseudomonadota bacterium]